MNRAIKNRQKSIQLRILARQKPGAKWRQSRSNKGLFTVQFCGPEGQWNSLETHRRSPKTQRSSSSGAQHLDVQGSIMRAVLLDRASISGGKCEPFNGSGKSPGLNQFAFCWFRRGCLVALEKAKTLGRLLPIAQTTVTVRCFKRFLAET